MRANAFISISEGCLNPIKISFLFVFPRQNPFFHFVHFHIRIFRVSFQVEYNRISLIIEAQFIEQSLCVYIKVSPGSTNLECGFILRIGYFDQV